jgi:hypothetical protein
MVLGSWGKDTVFSFQLAISSFQFSVLSFQFSIGNFQFPDWIQNLSSSTSTFNLSPSNLQPSNCHPELVEGQPPIPFRNLLITNKMLANKQRSIKLTLT